MTASHELIALRNYLTEALDAVDVTHINMRAIADAAEPALGRGWTGRELAANAVAGVYSGAIESPGAYIVANLRALGTVDPPREVTPTPPPIAQVLADMHSRHTPAASPSEWVAKLRAAK